MEISVLPTTGHIDRSSLVQRVVIILDILRSTTCIVTALANGCRGVIPALNCDEALLIARGLENGSYLLAGENRGQKIKDFHLGNSPHFYRQDQLRKKYIIMATTNGTRAIVRSAGARKVLIGSFLNAGMVCQYAARLNNKITIACAGTQGKFSLEDAVAAGMLIDCLKNYYPGSRLTDLALAAKTLYHHHKKNLLIPLLVSQNGRSLKEQRLLNDIHFAQQLNIYPIVPVYEGGVIKQADLHRP